MQMVWNPEYERLNQLLSWYEEEFQQDPQNEDIYNQIEETRYKLKHTPAFLEGGYKYGSNHK